MEQFELRGGISFIGVLGMRVGVMSAATNENMFHIAELQYFGFWYQVPGRDSFDAS